MKRYMLWLPIIILLYVGLVSGATWDNGQTCTNLTFNGSNNQSLYLSFPLGLTFENAIINFTAGKKVLSIETTENSSIETTENGWNVTTYSGLWFNHSTDGGGSGGDLLNPHYTDDGSLLTSSQLRHGSAGTYYASHYIINFSLSPNSTTSLGLRARFMSLSSELYPMCKDKTTGFWELLLPSQRKISFSDTLPHNYSIDILSGCIDENNSTIEIDLFCSAKHFLGEVRIADVWIYNNITYNNITSYPENLTIYLNETVLSYNNDSVFNGSHNLSLNVGYLNEFYATETNLTYTFLSNKSGILNACVQEFSRFGNQSVTIRHELNRNVASGLNVSLNRIVNETAWDGHWTTTGYLNLTNINISSISDVEYYPRSGEYPTRHFYYKNVVNTSYIHTFYIVPFENVTQVLFTLYRETGTPLENYYIEVYKRWKDTNEYLLVEGHKTNFNGQAIMNLEILDDFYKFKVYDTTYNLIYESDETQIYSDTLSLTVRVVEDIWGTLENRRNILFGAPRYDNTTQQFMTHYTDPTGIVDYIQFTTIRRTLFGDFTICDNKSYATSATLYCTINPNQSGVFISQVFLESNTNHSPGFMGGAEYSNTQTPGKTGQLGLFLMGIFIVGVAALGMFNPVVAIVLAVLALIFGVLMNIIYLQIGTLVTLAILGGILVFKMRT